MQCTGCEAEVERMDTAKLLACSGLTLHEYALWHRLSLDLLVSPEQVNVTDLERNYPLDYLPGLSKIQLCKTSQSWSCYSGPDLGRVQGRGGSELLHYFTGLDACQSECAR